MSDYTVPPLPDHPEPYVMAWTADELTAIHQYGGECAEAARAPLLEHIERLKGVMKAAQEGWNDDYRLLQEATARIAELNGQIERQAAVLRQQREQIAELEADAKLCPCKDRTATDCPGEWEPGCDLGANAAHAVPSNSALPRQPTLQPVAQMDTSKPCLPDGWVATMRALVHHIERETCTHEETYRGGAIWEICRDCGEKWSDDRNPKPEFAWPKCVEDARALLAAAPEVPRG